VDDRPNDQRTIASRDLRAIYFSRAIYLLLAIPWSPRSTFANARAQLGEAVAHDMRSSYSIS